MNQRLANTREEARKTTRQAEAIRFRYTLRRAAQGLLFDRDRQGAEGQHRTCFCGRGVREGQHGVSVYRTATGKARYRGLTACGDVWACPSCAAKIAGERRKELEKALVSAHLSGFHGYLLTLTFPHEAGMGLSDLAGAFAKAMQGFKNSRTYKGFMERHGRLGQIKALEVKHGGNGWHPHVHELVFARPGLLEDVRGLDALRSEWVKQLLKRGLGDSSQRSDMLAHALDFRGGDDAAAYIAKFGHDEAWGIASEMTQGMKKIGRDSAGHHTPFELLAMAQAGDGRAAALYMEYAAAMKGKRAITWTRGLRKALFDCEDEATDEALAALDDPKPDEDFVVMLPLDLYQELLARKLEGDYLYHVGIWLGELSEANALAIANDLIATRRRTASGFLASVGHGVKKLVGMNGQFGAAE
jgi:hypothetical protein